MKHVLKILVAVLLLSCMLSVVLADTPAPKYTGEAVYDKDEYTVIGTVTHQEGTEKLKQVFARITYFKADGTYTIVPAPVNPDGSFETMYSGDLVHISVQIIDVAKIVPGTYTRLGGFEFDIDD